MFDEGRAIERLLSGDSEVAEKIVNQFEAAVYQYCLYFLGNQRGAEEAAIAVFVRLFSQLGPELTEASLKEWIMRIAVNVCADLQRHHRSRREKAESFEEQLGAALQRLVRQQRTILLLSDLIGMDQKTIGSILEMEEKTVCQRLARARNNLCDFLIQSGAELEGRKLPRSRDRHSQSYRDLCSRYVDDHLEEAEKKQLLDHIQECPVCAAYLQDLTKIGRALSHMSENGMPDSLKADIMEAVRMQAQKAQEGMRRRMHFPVFTLIAVAAVVVLLVCSGSFGGLLVDSDDVYDKVIQANGGSMQLTAQDSMEFGAGEIPESVLASSYSFAIAAVGGEGLPEFSTEATAIATDEQNRTYYEVDSDLASVERLTEMLENVNYRTLPIYDNQIVIAGTAQNGLLVIVPETEE
ncbi:MAG: sigma-70 family RNA polymerase sigma factor [Eubacteriales bacterium]|nr:sigma-70 family RNA polymerase sigma factor [Eubacteriales bacterium]